MLKKVVVGGFMIRVKVIQIKIFHCNYSNEKLKLLPCVQLVPTFSVHERLVTRVYMTSVEEHCSVALFNNFFHRFVLGDNYG